MCHMSGGMMTASGCVRADAEDAVSWPQPTGSHYGECKPEETHCTFYPAKMKWGRSVPAFCHCPFKKGVAQALADASTVAVKTSDDGPSFAVSALAVLGLGAMVYGAGRYYLSKE